MPNAKPSLIAIWAVMDRSPFIISVTALCGTWMCSANFRALTLSSASSSSRKNTPRMDRGEFVYWMIGHGRLSLVVVNFNLNVIGVTRNLKSISALGF